MSMISVTILTKNSARSLKRTLESTRNFKEVIILDTGSQDETLDIARAYPNTKIYHSEFEGFGLLHNKASVLATYSWILSLDSDEVLSPALIQEIHSIHLNKDYVYILKRHNYFNGKWIRGCGGWHPDHVARLYNKETTKFSSSQVHEYIICSGHKKHLLKNPILHTPYLHIGDFLHKMQLYSDLFAKNHPPTGSVCKALVHSWLAFFKSYILKRGFLEGKEGFIISLYNAHTTLYKYLKTIKLKD